MILQFSKELMLKHPAIYSYVENSYLNRFIQYFVNNKFRQSITLQSWLQKLLDPNTTDPGILAGQAQINAVADEIGDGEDYDETMILILRYVESHMTYRTDKDLWKMPDYWQTPDETIDNWAGDCEDGAVLMYALARAKGIPADRLLIFCGDVQDPMKPSRSIGHATLLYRPISFPLNVAVIDWCYNYDRNFIMYRNLYYIDGQDVKGYIWDGSYTPTYGWQQDQFDKRYTKMWFCFNENKSFFSLRYERHGNN